jgi:hypothetical protein
LTLKRPWHAVITSIALKGAQWLVAIIVLLDTQAQIGVLLDPIQTLAENVLLEHLGLVV